MTGSTQTKAHEKKLEERERGRTGTAQIFMGTPDYLRNGKSYGTHQRSAYPGTAQIFMGTPRTKAHEKFWRKGAWAYPGTAQIFMGTPY